MHWLLNLTLGGIPAAVLAVSIAAGTEDDRHHRRVFLLVYGLWAITLAMWNWMRSAPTGWIVLWLVAGLGAVAVAASRKLR
jgi:hypothetical protein